MGKLIWKSNHIVTGLLGSKEMRHLYFIYCYIQLTLYICDNHKRGVYFFSLKFSEHFVCVLFNCNILVPKDLLLGVALYLHGKSLLQNQRWVQNVHFKWSYLRKVLDCSKMPVTVTCPKNYLMLFMLIFNTFSCDFFRKEKAEHIQNSLLLSRTILSSLFPSPEVVT